MCLKIFTHIITMVALLCISLQGPVHFLHEELIDHTRDALEKLRRAQYELVFKRVDMEDLYDVARLDTRIADNKIVAYRARVKISFKYEGKE